MTNDAHDGDPDMVDAGPSASLPVEPEGPVCGCGGVTALRTGRELFPSRADLFTKLYWVCTVTDCDGRVGCHSGTSAPLGVPAGNALRRARLATHRMLDPFWRTADRSGCYTNRKMKPKVRHALKRTARNRVYAFLAAKLGLPIERAHIGAFDLDQCTAARNALRGIGYSDIRSWAKGVTDIDGRRIVGP